MKKHPDGSICKEGTKKVPRKWKPCCENFAHRTTSCDFDIRFEWHKKIGWGITIHESAGGGMIVINYCPHCGVKL